MFKRIFSAAVTAVVFATALTGSMTYADAMAKVPGNNGTIKVHELGTPSRTESNDPKVCNFNIEGFGFDAGQTGYVVFTVQGGDQPTGKNAGPYAFGPVGTDGFVATQYFKLSDGHYKVTLYGKDTKGQIDYNNQLKAKSKVFKVSCDHAVVTPSQTEPSCPPETPSSKPQTPKPQTPTTPVVTTPAKVVTASSAAPVKVALPAELPQTGATPLPAFIMLLAGTAAYGLVFALRESGWKLFGHRLS